MKTYGLIFTNDDPSAAPAVSLAPTLITFYTIGGTTLTPPGITKPISTLGFYTFEWQPTLPIYFLADGGTLVTDTTQRYLSGILDPVDAVNEQANTLIAFGGTNIALNTLNLAQGTSIVSLGNTSIATTAAYGNTNIALGTSILAQGLTMLGYGETIYAIATTLAGQNLSLSINIDANSTLLQLINLSIGSTASPFGDSSVDPDTIYGYLRRLQEFNEGDQTFNKLTGAWTINDRSGTTTIATKSLTNNNTQVTKS